MGLTIIRKEIAADRRRRIYEQRQPFVMPVGGVTKSVDEAHDIAYHQHGEQTEPMLVAGDVPEMRQAHEDQLLRVGKLAGRNVDPDEHYRHWQKEERERAR